MKRLLLGTMSLFLFVGCVTGPKSRKDVAKEKYLKHQVSKSNRARRPFNPANCPSSESLWKGYSWKKLVESANSCVVAERWARLKLIGNHLATTHPLAPWGVYFLSLHAEQEEDFDRALWMADLALQKAPQLGILKYQKARVLWHQERPEAAIRHAHKSLDLDPNLVDAHLFLGEVYLRDHLTGRAEDHFEEVLKKEPQNVIATAGMADLHSFERDNSAAIEYLSKLVDMEPNVLKYRAKLGQLYEREEQKRKALLTYETIRRLIKEKELDGSPDFDLNQKIKNLEVALERSENEKNRAALRKPANERKVSQ